MSDKTYTPEQQAELFRFIDRDDISSEKITAPRYSYWKSVFRVFFRKKINIFMIAVFVFIFLVAFIMPIFWPYDMMENVTNAATFHPLRHHLRLANLADAGGDLRDDQHDDRHPRRCALGLLQAL